MALKNRKELQITLEKLGEKKLIQNTILWI
jgi:hypothetical protein